MNELNILLTSAGRRGYLVEYFKKALGDRGEVHVGNSDALAPSFFYADKYVVTPLIYDDNYIPFLLNYCLKNSIKIVISLFDVDLMILAKNKELFKSNGIEVIVSNELVIDICNDKWNTYNFAREHNIGMPHTFLSCKTALQAIEEKMISFPVVVKPRWGMGSIGIYFAENEQELCVFYEKVKRDIFKSYLRYESVSDSENCVLIQEYIEGKEYGLDIINDLNGNNRAIIVREKLGMRSGETDSAKVVINEKIKDFGRLIGEKLSHIGNLDLDIMVRDENMYLIEMNARFGGGYPYSHCSGVDLPKAIVKWVIGENLDDELVIKEFDRIYQKDINMIDMSPIINSISI